MCRDCAHSINYRPIWVAIGIRASGRLCYFVNKFHEHLVFCDGRRIRTFCREPRCRRRSIICRVSPARCASATSPGVPGHHYRAFRQDIGTDLARSSHYAIDSLLPFVEYGADRNLIRKLGRGGFFMHIEDRGGDSASPLFPRNGVAWGYVAPSRGVIARTIGPRQKIPSQWADGARVRVARGEVPTARHGYDVGTPERTWLRF